MLLAQPATTACSPPRRDAGGVEQGRSGRRGVHLLLEWAALVLERAAVVVERAFDFVERARLARGAARSWSFERPVLLVGGPSWSSKRPVLARGRPVLVVERPVLLVGRPVLVVERARLARGRPSWSSKGPSCSWGGPSWSSKGPSLLGGGGPSCSWSGPSCSWGGPSCSWSGPSCSWSGPSCSWSGRLDRGAARLARGAARLGRGRPVLLVERPVLLVERTPHAPKPHASCGVPRSLRSLRMTARGAPSLLSQGKTSRSGFCPSDFCSRATDGPSHSRRIRVAHRPAVASLRSSTCQRHSCRGCLGEDPMNPQAPQPRHSASCTG